MPRNVEMEPATNSQRNKDTLYFLKWLGIVASNLGGVAMAVYCGGPVKYLGVLTIIASTGYAVWEGNKEDRSQKIS